MAAIQTNPLPKGYKLQSSFGPGLSKVTSGTLLPVGPAYLSHLRLTTQHNNSFESFDVEAEKERQRIQELLGDGAGVEDDLGVGDEKETDELLASDPKEWKKQDNYAVLGLSHLRYKATPEQIKIAHRKKVLKHHPDKKVKNNPTTKSTSSLLSGMNLNTNDDSFFKCIQKAHEVLTNVEKRRQFDSVDPDFMDAVEDIPTAAQFKSGKKDFFKTYEPVFEREGRFSKTQPVPLLGNADASKQHVEGFYDFWYNFDSWRSFEWMDKEVNEGSDSRDDKRYTEKKNKTDRAKRKKDDIARVRSLVDLALSLDPRIKRIKQEEKEAREAKKLAKSNPGSGANTPRPTKSKAEEEAEKLKKEEEDKAAKAEAKKQKAAAANAAKKARRAQRTAEDGEAAA